MAHLLHRPLIRSTVAGTVAVAALLYSLLGCRRESPPPPAASAASVTAASAAPTQNQPAADGETASGEKLYQEHCAQCHMADGSGVPGMQPELIGSPIIAGDRARLELVIRAGSNALRDRQSDFQNEMPPFAFFTPAQMDALIGYLRQHFGPGSGAAPEAGDNSHG